MDRFWEKRPTTTGEESDKMAKPVLVGLPTSLKKIKA
jgi:hypothetical protein